MKTAADRIAHLTPCSEAKEWASGYTSAAKAWKECPRGDWMLWLLWKSHVDRRRIVGAAGEIAAIALPIWNAYSPRDSRVADCIEMCRKYAIGEVGEVQLNAASDAAWAARASAWYDAQLNAAWAARAARAAASDTAWAARAVMAAAGAGSLATSAGIVRAWFPQPPTIKDVI